MRIRHSGDELGSASDPREGWGDGSLWDGTLFSHHLLDIDSRETEVEKEH